MTPDDADTQGDVLLAAAEASPIAQLKWHLREVGREWKEAASDAELAGADVEITLAGSLMPGMAVLFLGDGRDGFHRFRRIAQGGSLQLDDAETGRPIYVNLLSKSSPVVVRS